MLIKTKKAKVHEIQPFKILSTLYVMSRFLAKTSTVVRSQDNVSCTSMLCFQCSLLHFNYKASIGLHCIGTGWNLSAGETLESSCGLKNASRVSADLAATGYIWINYLNCEIFPFCRQVRDEKNTKKNNVMLCQPCWFAERQRVNFSDAPSPTFGGGLLLSGRKTSAALRTAAVRRDSSNCQCSAQPHVRPPRGVCVCVCGVSLAHATILYPHSSSLTGFPRLRPAKVWVTGQESNSRTMESFLYLTS